MPSLKPQRHLPDEYVGVPRNAQNVNYEFGNVHALSVVCAWESKNVESQVES